MLRKRIYAQCYCTAQANEKKKNKSNFCGFTVLLLFVPVITDISNSWLLCWISTATTTKTQVVCLFAWHNFQIQKRSKIVHSNALRYNLNTLLVFIIISSVDEAESNWNSNEPNNWNVPQTRIFTCSMSPIFVCSVWQSSPNHSASNRDRELLWCLGNSNAMCLAIVETPKCNYHIISVQFSQLFSFS